MGIVVAVQSAAVHNGTRFPTIVRRGDAWDGEDPVVAGNPSLFSADPAHPVVRRSGMARDAAVVEQSTRAPGERSKARRAEG